MTITLPPEIEGPLTEEARRQGTTAESLAVEALRKAFMPIEIEQAAPGETLYDRLAGFIGIVESGDGTLSQNCGEQFTEGLLEKRRQGHL